MEFGSKFGRFAEDSGREDEKVWAEALTILSDRDRTVDRCVIRVKEKCNLKFEM